MEGKQTELFCRGDKEGALMEVLSLDSRSAAEKTLKNTVCFPLVTLAVIAKFGVSLRCENEQKPHLKWSQVTFLVVQRVRICLPMQGARARSLILEESTRLGATKLVHGNC